MNPGLFFDLSKGKHVNSTIYRDQVFLKSLKDFWKESFEDVLEYVVLENNASSHKKTYIPIHQ